MQFHLQYDLLGRQKKLTDPDAGMYTYTYTGFGEVLTQTDPRQNETKNKYDVLGRVEMTTELEGVSEYVYDTRTNGLGMPATLIRKDASENVYYTENYFYDNLSRPEAVQKIVKNDLDQTMNSYLANYYYDNLGRLATYSYPSGYTINYEYSTTTGEMIKIKNGNSTLWQLIHQNELGQTTEYSYGNGIVTQNTFDPTTHLLTQIRAGSGLVQDLRYTYNAKMQLDSRTDYKRSLQESFTYDNSNRLTTISGNTNSAMSISFEANGNISSKSDVGTYVYDLPQVHAVSAIDYPETELVDIPTRLPDQYSLNYTSFNKVSEITENDKSLVFTYGPDHQRLITTFTDDITQTGKRKYFLGDFEIEENLDGTNRKKWHYISAPTGPVAVGEKIGTGLVQLHYIHTDNMGSINVITNSSGAIEQEYSFDAWGRMRNPTNWSYYAYGTEPALMFDRGYTGHEHLREFGLINMNGRCYDPLMARMLSPDPFVQAGNSTQSYNRYSYAFNNPFAFTDPSGYVNVLSGYNPLAENWISHAGSDYRNMGNYWAGMEAFYGVMGMGIAGASGSLGSGITFPPGLQLFFPSQGTGVTYNYITTINSEQQGTERNGLSAYYPDANGNFLIIQALDENGNSSFLICNTLTGERKIRGKDVFSKDMIVLSKTVHDVKRIIDRISDNFDRTSYPGIPICRHNNNIPQGFSAPPFAIVTRDFETEVFNEAYHQHEYGHYLQYEAYGASYYWTKIAIPSVIDVGVRKLGIGDKDEHQYLDFEKDATNRAYMFFGNKQQLTHYPSAFPR